MGRERTNLNKPVEEVAHHARRRDMCILWQTVVQARQRRPDSLQHLQGLLVQVAPQQDTSTHLIHALAPRKRLYSEPKHAQDHTADDGEVA